jgi:hypothetical protein
MFPYFRGATNNLRNFNNLRNIRSPAVVPPHDAFMMPALFARKASDADAPNLNPWRPAI